MIEAVFEDMSVKQEIFRKLDKICHPRTYLWTNTSGLNIEKVGNKVVASIIYSSNVSHNKVVTSSIYSGIRGTFY